MQQQEQYLRELRRQGYTTVRSLGRSHLKIYDPAGHLVGVHSGNGGSDHRSLANLKADIRRHVCLGHRDRDDQAQEPRRGNPVGDRESRGYRRKKPQRTEDQRRDDQHPSEKIPVETHRITIL